MSSISLKYEKLRPKRFSVQGILFGVFLAVWNTPQNFNRTSSSTSCFTSSSLLCRPNSNTRSAYKKNGFPSFKVLGSGKCRLPSESVRQIPYNNKLLTLLRTTSNVKHELSCLLPAPLTSSLRSYQSYKGQAISSRQSSQLHPKYSSEVQIDPPQTGLEPSSPSTILCEVLLRLYLVLIGSERGTLQSDQLSRDFQSRKEELLP